MNFQRSWLSTAPLEEALSFGLWLMCILSQEQSRVILFPSVMRERRGKRKRTNPSGHKEEIHIPWKGVRTAYLETHKHRRTWIWPKWFCLFVCFCQRASYFKGEAADDWIFGRGSSAAVGLLPWRRPVELLLDFMPHSNKNEGFLWDYCEKVRKQLNGLCRR